MRHLCTDLKTLYGVGGRGVCSVMLEGANLEQHRVLFFPVVFLSLEEESRDQPEAQCLSGFNLLWCHPPSPGFAGAGLLPRTEPCLCFGKAQVQLITSLFVVTLLLLSRPLLRPVIYNSLSQ